MKYISIRNYEKYQHYKDRRPPWIKLYNDLLEDYDFIILPDDSKFHLIGMMLLASRNDNQIPHNLDFISSQLGAKSEVNLKQLKKFLLFSKGRNASTTIADDKQNDALETETETETYREETEREKKTLKTSFAEFVTLTEKQHETLVEQHGEESTKAFIEKLNDHKGAKGVKYKSDYHAIRKWVVDAVGKNGSKPETNTDRALALVEQLKKEEAAAK